MKKLLFLITILMVLNSCDNDKPKLVDSKKETTIQIQQLAQADSNFYKVVEIENKTYIVNKNNMVVKIREDYSGAVKTFGLLFLFLGIALLLFLTIELIH